MKKRILSILLALAMVFSMLPAMTLSAVAAGGETVWTASECEFCPAGDSANAKLVLTGVTSSGWDTLPESITIDLGAEFESIDSFAEACGEDDTLSITVLDAENVDDYSFSFLTVDDQLIISEMEVRYNSETDNYVNLRYSVHIHHFCGDVECTDSSHEYIEFKPWAEKDEIELPDEPGCYYLTNNVNLTETWRVPTGKVTLCLNGHVINLEAGSGSVIEIGNDSELELCDCSTEEHCFIEDENGLWCWDDEEWEGENYVTGGCITGGTGSYVEDSEGVIGGGGVLVNGSFTMTGGTITGNSACYGGGVYVGEEASFTMTGGTITGNTVFKSGEFGSEPAGGGVYFNALGFSNFVTLGGTAKIIENSGSNLYLGDDSAIQIREYGDNAPAQGMSVGVTTENGPYEGTPVTFAAYALSTDAKYFFADNEDYAVAFGNDEGVCDEGCLQLVVPQAEDYYPVRIGGTQISRFNKDDVLRDGGSVSFDPETNTLTLNNMVIGTDAESSLWEAIESKLPEGETLTVKLIGTNVIGRAPDEECEEYTVNTGLYIDKASMAKKANPDGSLLLIGDENSSLTINAEGTGIEGGNTGFGEDGENGKKFEGELKIFSQSEAIKSHKSVFVNGGNIFMKSQDEGISAEQNVAVSGGKLTIRAERRGIEAENDVTLSGGEILVAAKEEGVHAENDITLSGVTLDVTGGEGYSAIFADGSFSITDIDCQIIARGNDETYGAIYSGSAPSFAAGLTILGSTAVDATIENITDTAQMVPSEEESDYYVVFIGEELAQAVTFKQEEQHTTHDGIEFQPWIPADHDGASLPTEADSWYLTDDVTISANWNVPEGTTNLCLNGNVLNLNGYRIDIPETATLNLFDCGEKEHTGNINSYHLWSLGEGKEGSTPKNIKGGIIYTPKDTTSFRIYGTLNMFGGTITGHDGSTGNYVLLFNLTLFDSDEKPLSYAGNFNMYGGTITGNVYASNMYWMNKDMNFGFIDPGKFESFTVGKDAVIDGNYILGPEAGGVYKVEAGNVIVSDSSGIKIGTGDYAPTSNMKIGVRTKTVPTKTKPVVFTEKDAQAYLGNFESNMTDFHIEARQKNALFLCPADVVEYVPHECTDHKETITGQAATCTEDGWKDYYKCTTCETLYSDEAMTTEITDLAAWKVGDGKLAKTGHDWTYATNGNVITATCENNGAHTATLTLTAENEAFSSEASYKYSKASASWSDTTYGLPEAVITYYIDSNTKTTPQNSGSLEEGSAPRNAGSYIAKASIPVGENSYTIEKAFSITKASVTTVGFKDIAQPAANVVAPTSVNIAMQTMYSGAISWSPALTNNTFGYSTAYTATITLTANSNYQFAEDVTLNALAGEGWTKSNTSTETVLVFTKTYAATAKAKITSVTPPAVTSPLAEFTTEAAQIAALPTTVAVAVEDGGKTSMAVTWALKNGSTYSTASNANNVFVWTVTASEYANYDTNSQTLTGEVTIQNPAHTHSWSYTVGEGNNADTITAKCSGAGDCDYKAAGVTLTLTAGNTTYTSDVYADASASWSTGTPDGMPNATIKYVGRDGTNYPESDTAPTAAGSYTAKASVTVGGQTYTATKDFEISKATLPTELAVSLTGWTYGATANNSSVTGNVGNGAVTYTYKVKGADDSTYTETKPVNAGSYTVRASIAETTNYEAATIEADFTIAKADMVVGTNILAPSVPIIPLVYDGNAQELLCAGQTWDEKDGATSFGTFYYSVDGKSWSTDLPTAINAGEYNPVWYFVGDENHNNIGSAEEPITQLYPIEIARGDQTVATVVMDGYTYGGTLPKPSISITPSENATVTYYYSATNTTTGGTEWKNMTATTLDAGTYYLYAVIAATDNFSSQTTEAVAFTIAKAEAAAPASGMGYTVDYAKETITPVSGYELSTGSGENFDAGKLSGETDIVFGTTYYVRKAADANHNASEGTPFSFTRPAAPAESAFTVTKESIQNKKDGSFGGITSAMEYSTDNGKTWTPGPKTLTGLSNETVKVRYKATTAAFKSEECSYTFEASTAKLTVNMNGAETQVAYGEKLTKPSPDPTRTGYTFGGWYKNEDCTEAWNFAADTVKDNMTLYPKWIKNAVQKAAITGTVTENNAAVPGATVELYLGTVKVAATVTNENGDYSFDNVENGTYNIVVTKGDKVKTELVTVNSTGSFSVNVALPDSAVNSVVEVEDTQIDEAKSNVSKTVVGGLDTIAAAQNPEAGQTITIKLTVEPKKESEVGSAEEIKREAGNGKKVEFLDLSLFKQVNNEDPENIGDGNTTLLTIVIPFDFSGVDVSSVMILRNHGDQTEKLTGTANDNGEYFKVDEQAGTLTIYAKQFSTYAIGYEERTSGGHSSGSYTPGHTVTSDLNNVTKVTIDGKVVDSKYYTVSGGTVYLTGEFMKTLTNGKHTVKLYDGFKVATGTITVTGNTNVISAATGDTGVALYAGLAISSVLGMSWVGRKKLF